MKLLIEGIGGIGGVLAAELVDAGQAPVLVTANDAITSAIEQDGLRVTTPQRRFVAHPRVHTTLEQAAADGPFDAALLLMKATGVVEAAKQTLPLLSDGGYLVACQNGIVEDTVSEICGSDRLVSCIIGWGGTMHQPGVVERTGPGTNVLGELDGQRSARVEQLAQLLQPSAPSVITTNIRGALWSKLAINCTITTGGALTGEPLGRLLRRKAVRRAFLGIYREVLDTALALRVKPERVALNPWLLYLPRRCGLFKRMSKDLLMRAIGLRYRNLKSSSLQSLERARPTEVDFLNGYVARKAAEVGVTAPLNAAITKLIHEIETRQRTIGPANIHALLAAKDGNAAATARPVPRSNGGANP